MAWPLEQRCTNSKLLPKAACDQLPRTVNLPGDSCVEEDNACLFLGGTVLAKLPELAGNFRVHSLTWFRDFSMAQMMSEACRRRKINPKFSAHRYKDNSLHLTWAKGNDCEMIYATRSNWFLHAQCVWTNSHWNKKMLSVSHHYCFLYSVSGERLKSLILYLRTDTYDILGWTWDAL